MARPTTGSAACQPRSTPGRTRGSPGRNTVWMRTSVVLDRSRYFDYQPTVPGINILLRLTNDPTIHRIEATPLD